MSHARAVVLMVLVTLMWSIAGVVTRHLEAARGFEVTFWRSFFTVLSLVAILGWQRGPRALLGSLKSGGRAMWISGACWSVMFTAFMLALTITTVANVLVTMAIAPLITALVARFVLQHRLPLRTWAAIFAAGAGIGWMFSGNLQGDPRHLLGMAVAAAVPVAAAVNWTTMQSQRGHGSADLLSSVLIGAVLSSLFTLPLALPLQASAHDLALLALLGLVQLAIPCLLVVVVARVLKAPEVSLLALLEVVLGVLWAWLGAGEAPSAAVLGGGLLVLGALAANEAAALRR